MNNNKSNKVSLDHSIKTVQDTLKSNLNKLLHRGENIQSLVSKANDLQNTSSLFKKRAKLLNHSTSIGSSNSTPVDSSHSSNSTSINSSNSQLRPADFDLDSINEYKKKLLEHYNTGHYQYVLDKSSQLGLEQMVQHILKLSESHPLYLNLADALLHAAHYGHLSIIETLLENDTQNDYEQQKYLLFLDLGFTLDDSDIDFTNQSLSRSDLQKAIVKAHTYNHPVIAQTLESYYYNTYNDKE
jgi:hypothetical protein